MNIWLMRLLGRGDADIFGGADYFEEQTEDGSPGHIFLRERNWWGILRLTEPRTWEYVDKLPRRRRKLTEAEVVRVRARTTVSSDFFPQQEEQP